MPQTNHPTDFRRQMNELSLPAKRGYSPHQQRFFVQRSTRNWVRAREGLARAEEQIGR